MATNKRTSAPAGKTPARTQVDPRDSSHLPAEEQESKDPTKPEGTQPASAPTGTDDTPVKPRAKVKEDLVSVTVHNAFNLTLDDTTRVRYEVGVQDMPRSHAEHFYAKANGVEKNED